MSEVAISAEQISREAATGSNAATVTTGTKRANTHSRLGSPSPLRTSSPIGAFAAHGHKPTACRLCAMSWHKRLAPQPPRKSWPVLRIVSVGIGTVVIAIAMIAATADLTFFASPREKTYSTGIGVRETIALPDGSQIELNTDTSVRLAEDGLHRHVTLDRGEAFFQVKHDATHPFVVVRRQSARDRPRHQIRGA